MWDCPPTDVAKSKVRHLSHFIDGKYVYIRVIGEEYGEEASYGKRPYRRTIKAEFYPR